MSISFPIIGNTTRRAELARDLESGNFSHAYLLAGPTEVGKWSAAKHFAHELILRETPAIDQPRVERELRTLIYPGLTLVDRLWVEEECEDFEELAQSSNFNQHHRAKKPTAKSDTLGLADLTEILARIATRHDGHHVVAIHRIERMTTEAANSFLKTLEEPPPRTIFLLTTDAFGELLPTIISRCRVLEFANVAPADIEAMLTTRYPALTPDERKRITTFSLGKPIRARRLAENPEEYTAYADYFRRLTTLFEKPELSAKLAFADDATKTPADITFFLEALTYFLRGFLLTRARKPETTSRYTPTKILTLLHATSETRDLIASNVNARLAVEQLILKI